MFHTNELKNNLQLAEMLIRTTIIWRLSMKRVMNSDVLVCHQDDNEHETSMQKTSIAVVSSHNYIGCPFRKSEREDYFHFENSNIFTQQANDGSRDNTCWKKYLDIRFLINPK